MNNSPHVLDGQSGSHPARLTTGYQMTPRTFKAAKSKSINLSTQDFKIGHQSVHIDVDMSANRIEGYTELILLPSKSQLRSVKLDCREMMIKRVTVNNKYAVDYVYSDLLHFNEESELKDTYNCNSINIFDMYSDDLTINQHHFLREKLNYIFGELNYDPRDTYHKISNGNTEELLIMLPENLKSDSSHGAYVNTPLSVPSTHTPFHTKRSNMGENYSAITLKIEYECRNSKNGVNFVTYSKDKRDWHVYTNNTCYSTSTSSWVPCIDNLWDKSTWSIEISVPRTVKDIGQPRVLESDTKGNHQPIEKEHEIENQSQDFLDEQEYSDGGFKNDYDFDNYELTVCVADFTNVKETAHLVDISKKVVSWSLFTPVCAHHVGWAIGPFQAIKLSDGSELNFDEDLDEAFVEGVEKDTSSVPLTVYCLPSQESSARNTCIFVDKAMDFFSREYGSFPFSSYSLIFAHDCTTNISNYAGITVLNDRLLYPENLIEPMFENTDIILEAIASQWSGVSLVPLHVNDFWCTIGIAKFMAYQFIKKLSGINEYKFKIKSKMNEMISKDIGRKPLALQYFRFPLSEDDFDFIRLKAPLVLFILDKRMTKTDKSFGLSRVLPKIFLQGMSGDIYNGALSTQHFQYVCEKVNRNKLEHFFKQWVFGAGVPIFQVTQRFNRKKLSIEVTIRQVQHIETKKLHPNRPNFLNDAIAYLDDEPFYSLQHVFTGPMTIRIHEADGTPYEHIVDIKEGNVKFDIQYNTRLRKMKKNRDENGDSNSIFSGLGNILTSKKEMTEWKLSDWTKTEEDILNDAFEWMRVDVDFEWIAKINVKQPFYMFISQLQYDRDVEAQLEAIRYLSEADTATIYHFTALTRTVMDENYYYGVREAASRALVKLSKPSNEFAGIWYLTKIFQTLYCFPNSLIPKSNDFTNFNNFFLLKSIPRTLAELRTEDGILPSSIKDIIVNLVKYNENSSNFFQDCFYLSELITALTDCAINSLGTGSLPEDDSLLQQTSYDFLSENKFLKDAVDEINRIEKLHEYVPCFQELISVTCITQKIKLAQKRLIPFDFESLMRFTLKKFPMEVRLEAFRGLLLLGGLRNSEILHYFLKSCLLSFDSAFFKSSMISILLNCICDAACNGLPSFVDDLEFDKSENTVNSLNQNGNNMVVFEDGLATESNVRRDKYARETLNGSIQLLRKDLSLGKGLKSVLWELMYSSLISIKERRDIFNMCQILYDSVDKYIVHLPIQFDSVNDLKKKIVARIVDEHTVVIKREGRFKIQLGSRKIILKNGRDKASEKQQKYNKDNAAERNGLKIKLNKPSLNPSTRNSSRLKLANFVSSDGSNPYKISIRLDSSVLANLKPQIFEFPKSESICTRIDATKVFIKFSGKKFLSPFLCSSNTPRYVRIDTKARKIQISSTPFTKTRPSVEDKQENEIELHTQLNGHIPKNNQAIPFTDDSSSHKVGPEEIETHCHPSDDEETIETASANISTVSSNSEPVPKKPLPKLRLKLNFK